MPAIKAKNIALMLKSKGLSWTNRHIQEHLDNGQLRPEDFSIRDSFEALVPDGREMVEMFSPRKSGGMTSREMMEAADAVSTSHFANVTGPVIFSKIMAASRSEDFVFSGVVPSQPTQFSGERIPGIGGIGDKAGVVKEGEAYPRVALNEDWQDTPPTVKRGKICSLTKEALFFDRTGLLLREAAAVGQWLGANKEKRLIDAIIDERVTDHRHKWRGTSYATYQSSTPWINLKSANGLTDWSNIDAAEQQWAALKDPNTGEPMVMSADTIIVTPENRAKLFHILNATNVGLKAGGFAVSGNLYHTDAPTPLGRHEYSGPYRVLSSRLLAAQMALSTVEPTTSWYMGRPQDAVVYMENWPITLEQAAAGSFNAFERDIVAEYKASEMGAAYVIQPRYLQKNTVA